MSMYNKIFTKILDSSVWLEPTSTRIVWITMIAAMDENGFCQFAAVGNVAGRARVSEDEARKALAQLEAPDLESSDPDNEGRRIERVPGGWIVLNAPKYRAIVTRVNAQERTKERVRRFREKKHNVTIGNADVTPRNGKVTPSEADTKAKVQKPSRAKRERATKTAIADERHATFKEAIKRYWDSKNPGIDMPWGPAEGQQLGMWLREAPHITLDQFTVFLRNRYKSDCNHGERPCQWLKWITSYGPGPTDRFKNTAKEDGDGKSNRGAAHDRVTRSRVAVAETALKLGWISPDSLDGGSGAEVPQPGDRRRDASLHEGLRQVGPEILPPERE